MAISIEDVLASLPPAVNPEFSDLEHSVRRLVKTREEAGYSREQALAGVGGILRRIACDWGLAVPEDPRG